MLTSHAHYPRTLHVRHVTNNQPFCAGVVLLQNGCLIVTLNSDGLPSSLTKEEAWRVGGIGSRQYPGETIWECAQRAAREALRIDIVLTSSPVTYVHDIDTGKTTEASCMDTIAPFLLERQSNFFPYTPYRPGLPAGPHTYFGFFFAQPQQALTQPGDNIAGLLFVPLKRWSLLQQSPTLETMLQQGASVLERYPLPRLRRLWLHPGESLYTVASLLAWHPELVTRQTFY